MEKTKTTLKTLFESRKDELAGKLANLTLPKDAAQIQQTVTDYLNELFDSEGDFRQNLTQSEDYLLQAAMSLLNAQQSMLGEFAKVNNARKTVNESQSDNPKAESITPNESVSGLKKQEYPYVIGGSAVGGVAGALLLGSWGAVFGAIAGTALALYYTTITGQSHKKAAMAQKPVPTKREEIANPVKRIDVDVFLRIVGNICDSVDSLILTFRTLIGRVVDKYESAEKPTFEKDYSVLLDSIQLLLGASMQPTDEKRQKRIDSRIEDLAESLENYNLQVVTYSGETANLFDENASDNVSQPVMVLPAIIKNGVVIRKGKVLVKE